MAKFPHFYQLDSKDCGPASLQIIAKYYGKYFELQELRELCGVYKEGVSVHDICQAAEIMGLKALPIKTSYKWLQEKVPLPCIIHWRNQHFVVVYKITKKKVFVSDPQFGLVTYTKQEFVKGWFGHLTIKSAWRNGVVIALEPTDKFNEIEAPKQKPTGLHALKYILAHLKPYKKQSLQLIAVLFIITAIQAVFPLISQSVVDIGISSKDISFIYLLLIANIVLVISTSAGNWIRQSINLHIASRVKISLLSNYIIKLLKLPLSFFERKLIGDILQRASDYERLESFIMNSVFSIVLAVLNLTVFGVILYVYMPILLWIFLAGSLLYVFWVLLFWSIKKKMDIRYFSLMGENQSHWIEMLGNIQDVKNNNYEQGKRWKWEKVQVKLYHVGVKLLNVNQAEQLGANFISTLRDVLLTFISALAVIKGDITLGMLVAIQFIIGQLKGPVSEVILFISSYQMAYISFMRMNEVNQVKEEQSQEQQANYFFPVDNSIKLKNVSFRYTKNQAFVLKNISLVIPKGKVTAIVGASGSGKSTLLKILLRLYTPTSGEVFVGSVNAESISLKLWRSKLGVVTQESTTFNDTILNNIILGESELDKEKLFEAVNIACVQHEIEKLPAGYNTMMGENGRGLSEGQKQRVLIARAVYKNPEYLFFDEATNALDSQTEDQVTQNLNSYFEDKTVIIAAHRLSTIKNADQIIVLEDGIIVEKGNHEQLIKKKGVYLRLFQSQMTTTTETQS